jgi:hypothetical protein
MPAGRTSYINDYCVNGDELALLPRQPSGSGVTLYVRQ